jgi:hypothetical protein
MVLRRFLFSLGLIALASVSVYYLLLPRFAPRPLQWKEVDMGLPASIRVYSALSTYSSLGSQTPRAWYVDIDYNDKSLEAYPYLSSAKTGRETGSSMAKKLGAIVAINGGYFDMEKVPAPTYSLVMRDGRTLVPNVDIVKRTGPTRAYPVTRSAFGISADRKFDVAWVAQQADGWWSYPQPVAHNETTVAPKPTKDYPRGGRSWNVTEAIGAGPTLISDGVIQDTYENEVFFGSGFKNNDLYSRAAIGYTKNNHLILFVTDGRNFSLEQGLTLPQTAKEMQRLGCREAMNLDGGGSETLVVNGKCLNQSKGGERPITSVLAFLSNRKQEEN